jgi:hypothetical protein
MRIIKRQEVGQVRSGMYVVQEDDESLTTDEAVNADYLADEADWQHVVKARHWADGSRLTLAMYNGETYQTGFGSGIVWVLWETDDDSPVVDEPELDDFRP